MSVQTKTKTKVNAAVAAAALGVVSLAAAGVIFFSAKDFLVEKDAQQNYSVDFNNLSLEHYKTFSQAVSGCELKTGIKVNKLTEKEEGIFRGCLKNLNDGVVDAILDFIDNPDPTIMANSDGGSKCGCRYSNSNAPRNGDACVIGGSNGTCSGSCDGDSKNCIVGTERADLGDKISVFLGSWGGNLNK
jgi:hypothetical protein